MELKLKYNFIDKKNLIKYITYNPHLKKSPLHNRIWIFRARRIQIKFRQNILMNIIPVKNPMFPIIMRNIQQLIMLRL